MRLSVLDVSPVFAGSSSAEALRNTLDLARFVDPLGYTRYWLAEHHNTAGIASSVPEIMIGHVASVTRHLRVGSGGIMLANHAPLKVAETFRLLTALHPGRIDLGLGRAPGTDALTALALRRSRAALSADDFPEQLAELMAFLEGDFPDDHPFRGIRAVPEDQPTPPIWLLGSSDFSARLAAELGLGFSFAHHIAPHLTLEMLRLYRARFRPSALFPEPRAILATSAICAPTAETAERLARPMDLVWLRMEQGKRGVFPSQAEAEAYTFSPAEQERVLANRARHFIGAPVAVSERLSALASATGADELMIMTNVEDQAARRESYRLLARAFALG